jgi:hypothetical protein
VPNGGSTSTIPGRSNPPGRACRGEQEYADHPEFERAELELLLLRREEELNEVQARTAAEAIASRAFSLLKTKVEEELGLPYGQRGRVRIGG